MRHPTRKKPIAICDEQAVINGGIILKHTKAQAALMVEHSFVQTESAGSNPASVLQYGGSLVGECSHCRRRAQVQILFTISL